MAEEPKNTSEVEQETQTEHPDEPWITDEEWVKDLNVRWRKVINRLMEGKLIYEAYAKAYDIEIDTSEGKNLANAAGSRLLRNVKFKTLWHKVIEERGFNDEAVDWALADLITNPDVDPSTRRAAIKDYNELRGRVIKKTDITTGGQGFFTKSKLEINVVEDPKTEDQSDSEDSSTAT